MEGGGVTQVAAVEKITRRESERPLDRDVDMIRRGLVDHPADFPHVKRQRNFGIARAGNAAEQAGVYDLGLHAQRRQFHDDVVISRDNAVGQRLPCVGDQQQLFHGRFLPCL
jgi:hypothetical protein